MAILYAKASGEDITRILDKLESTLKGESRSDKIISMLAGVLLLQYPSISNEDLVKGVIKTSEGITIFLTELTSLVEAKDLN